MTSQFPWADPLEYASALQGEKDLVLLYSGMQPGTQSILAWGLVETTDDLDKFEKKLTTDKNKFENCWFGYFEYEAPKMLMMRFENILIFNHLTNTVTYSSSSSCPSGKLGYLFDVSSSRDPRASRSEPEDDESIRATNISSNMTDAEYLKKTQHIINQIHAGELYQANLTRKFRGQSTADPFTIFTQLTKLSPAPYSAFIKHGKKSIISASPEKFITIENGIATTQPIKGTLSANDPASMLANSDKDKAENLMIVDLMRNDLSKTCRNVRVEKLFEITSYKTYHHMSSTITGELNGNLLNVIKNCFPPGSMTGAPKLKAIQLCAELENAKRGIYSGALGYFGGNGSCDLSVVIRTILFDGGNFEFQVGGGIVADSIPEKELEEIYVKSKAIFEVLNIHP